MQIMSLVSAPFVGLVLILMLTGFVRDPPTGLPLLIAYDDRRHEEICEDGRLIIVRVLTNGKVNLNNEVEMRPSELGDRLNQIFRTRAERVLFIEADADLPVSSVAGVIDISQSQVDRVVIVTPTVEAGYCLSIYRNPQGVL
jgi:biopolymer transport protein ExbD/biopolymer transport protein TolR